MQERNAQAEGLWGEGLWERVGLKRGHCVGGVFWRALERGTRRRFWRRIRINYEKKRIRLALKFSVEAPM